jgi:hypothetical protein
MTYKQICREIHALCAQADEPTNHNRAFEYKRAFSSVWFAHKIGALTDGQYMSLHRDVADAFYLETSEDRADRFLEGNQ